ncbi:glycosyltransferase family 4 protein [Streptomyces mesophilus]|uniref:glycosyltransferase family 4 protein n=1 Tax=Streptomyces mesophilus TaxID=1775132 RepID=UPI0033284944
MPTPRPLRITARVHAYPPAHNAGGEWMLHSMLRALVERGHEVSVWLSRYGQIPHRYILDGVQVIPFQARIDFAAHARDSDVLVSHLENVPMVAALAREYGVAMAAICHNTHLPTFRHAAGVDLAVYNSHWMRAEAEVFYGEFADHARPQNTAIVRPPVYAEEYRTTPGECVTLVNLNADKGGDLFWRIAARMPETEFLGVLGAYGDQILPPHPLPNLEIIDHVSGHDMREKVYARSRVMVMPSSYESWGRVGVEAMASGIPVVAHPTPGLTESLGHAGIFADRDDLDSWLSVLASVLELDAYATASTRALERSAELDPAGDLKTWADAVETFVRRRGDSDRDR